MGGSSSKTTPTFNVYENAAPGTSGNITASTNEWHSSVSTWAVLSIAALLAAAAILLIIYCFKRLWHRRQQRRAERSVLLNAIRHPELAVSHPPRPAYTSDQLAPPMHPHPPQWLQYRSPQAAYYVTNECQFRMDDLQPLATGPGSPPATLSELPRPAPETRPSPSMPAIDPSNLPISTLPRNSIWRT